MPDANGSSASAGPAQSSSKAPAFKGAPISGVFAIDKPSGPSSASLLEQLKPLFSHSVLFRDPHAKKQFNGGGGGKKARMEAKYKKEKGISLLAQIKMGHGGTLDPLASGVLVIGINNGTKAMGSYQSNSKKGYDATVLLGCETDSYDAKGKVVGFKEWRHVDRQMVEDACVSLRGEGTQIPPLFSALKMDGEPLYWYARNNKPLPRPIEARPCTVHRLDLTSWTPGGEHDFKWPTEHLTEEEREVRKRVGELVEKAGVKGPQEGEVTKSKEAEKVLVDENGPVPAQLVEAESGAAAGDKRRREDDASPTDPKRARRDTDAEEAPSPARDADALEADQSSSLVFEISMTVSSGTYVRTIAHDIGRAVGSAAHVVTLRRTQQGDFSLADCIDWSVFEKAFSDGSVDRAAGDDAAARDDEGLLPWERELVSKMRRLP